MDILQPCVTFNKVNTFQWFKDNTEPLPRDYVPTDRQGAFAQACRTCEGGKIPIGIFYTNPKKPYHEEIPVYQTDTSALWQRSRNDSKLDELIRRF